MSAFVTGGSRGIGRAIVLKLAQQGRDVAFSYVNNADAARETERLAADLAPGRRVQGYALDVCDSAGVERVVDQVIEDYENVDTVVNNAAILRNNAAALMSDEDWNQVIATNLTGPFFVTRQFLMHFLSNRSGRIINISSIAQDGASGQVNYAASKAGLVGMTKTLAREYGPKGITANVVVLGLVPTDMSREHGDEKLEAFWKQWCPRKRQGTPEEVASLVHFLSSDAADFINGEVIHISGGLTYVP
ncbi:MAG: 3-oxoacyl-ACP reductase FabG [Bradymonadaceae bacterium]|nr:3-oxoacyl-ACP reductase FabG [Lujinxingiaceae bacterium]